MRIDERDGREHELVDAEHDGRNACTADARLCQDAFETEMREVTQERACGLRECERVSPEEPLEADDCDTHHADPYHRKCILSPQETRVEEADTWNHQPYEPVE